MSLKQQTLSNDTVEQCQEILKEEISKTNDKLKGKIHQLCQDKSPSGAN